MENKKILKVFFDYACPYCMRGHAILNSIIGEFSGITVEYNPCESHPRPERFGPHSDLCIRGMFFAQDNGADMEKWHEAMYLAIHKDGVNVEDKAELSRYADGIIDGAALKKALEAGMYTKELARANSYAYEKAGVWVVPAYRLNGLKLNVIEDVGVTKNALHKFLTENS